MTEMVKKLAIMKGVRFGLNDRDQVALTFSTYEREGSAAGQNLNVDQTVEMIKAAKVRDIKDLEGKPCWIETDGQFMHYIRPWKA